MLANVLGSILGSIIHDDYLIALEIILAHPLDISEKAAYIIGLILNWNYYRYG